MYIACCITSCRNLHVLACKRIVVSAMYCLDLEAITNATADIYDTAWGTVVTYTCHSGTLFSDGWASKERQCVLDGEWTHLTDECQGTVVSNAQ